MPPPCTGLGGPEEAGVYRNTVVPLLFLRTKVICTLELCTPTPLSHPAAPIALSVPPKAPSKGGIKPIS